MVIPIGGGSGPSEDLVDIFLECHERIRRFTALARAAGEREGATEAEVLDACSRAERYFTEALPLHTLDEDRTLLPRLRGRSLEVDAALILMRAQHVQHEVPLAALLEASAALRAAPGDPARRTALARAASALEREMEEHLRMEEARVFPAIREFLSAEVQAEIRDELRDRRRPA